MPIEYHNAEYCEFMYLFYDKLMQQPNQSPACKEFRLERQQYYAERYCQLTSHVSPMPSK